MREVTMMRKVGNGWEAVPLPPEGPERTAVIRSAAGTEALIEIKTTPYLDPDDPSKGTFKAREFLCGTEALQEQMNRKFKDAPITVKIMTVEGSMDLAELCPDHTRIIIRAFCGPEDVKVVLPEKPAPGKGWEHLRPES
jgi:hypothetical protein